MLDSERPKKRKVRFLRALCGCSQRTQRSKAFTAEVAKGRRGRWVLAFSLLRRSSAGY